MYMCTLYSCTKIQFTTYKFMKRNLWKRLLTCYEGTCTVGNNYETFRPNMSKPHTSELNCNFHMYEQSKNHISLIKTGLDVT